MSEILLQMRNVTKRFPGVVALKNVNLELHQQEILGICGENGAGKSTLMKVLSGSYGASEYEGELLIVYLRQKLCTVRVELFVVNKSSPLGNIAGPAAAVRRQLPVYQP